MVAQARARRAAQDATVEETISVERREATWGRRRNGRGRRQHFSMLRSFHLADFFTLANGSCGTAAIFFAMAHMREAMTRAALRGCGRSSAWLSSFDVVDGRVARWRHRASPLGRELDSLADVISFGVAPASLAYAAGMNGILDQLVLLYFVACGISRLARYNITAESMAAADGQGDVLRGHAASLERACSSRCSSPSPAAGRIGDALPLGSVSIGGAVPAPARPGVRGVRIADDQQDASHPQAVRLAGRPARPSRQSEGPAPRRRDGAACALTAGRDAAP